MPVQPGDVIAGKYVVDKVLAAGGMGLVLAAHHKQLKRRVALKFLLPEFCSAPRVVERFLREAQAMTAIQNEHVARVIDVGTTSEGVPYMVMEYLEGEDLEQTLGRRGKLPPSEAVDYLLQGMEALAEAHVNGFVHRDLKPSNLFVIKRPDGSPLVKLLDFGISKALPTDDNPVELELTETRGMLGSPLYMAPEQIRDAKSVDIRADIWTLGIILYELLVGTSPFAGGNNVAVVLSAILAEGPVTLSSEPSSMPSGLSEIILRCLSRERDDRYQTVADLAAALEPFAPPEAKLSVVRIRKTLAHHQRTSSSSSQSVVSAEAPAVAAESSPVPVSGLAQTVAVSASDAPTASSPSGSSGLAAPRDPKDSDANDSTFGKYKLLAQLGHGAIADVFLALVRGPDGLGFSKLVVVKRLRSDLVSDDESVGMLVDEARIAAKLNHPNVIQTHEVGEIDGEYYIAMEYLEGQSLQEILQRTTTNGTTMPLAFRLGVVRDLLAGLHHAHELVDIDGSSFGLVHRDISPHNVFVTYDGQVKVVNFGIAKVKGRMTETQLGMIKGNVRYMSPEQAGSEAMDRRADVFGAGIVCWELLTEKRMWDGLAQAKVLEKLTSDEIPCSPRAVAPDIAEALDTIVTKALARSRSDRYATAQDLQLEIERYMEKADLKCAPRELGAWVGEMFADRRKEVRSLLDTQLSSLRASEGSPSFRVLKLRDPRSDRAALPSRSSSSAPDPSDRESGRSDNSSGLGALARSDPGATGTTGSWTRPRSRWVAVGGGAALVATALVIGSLSRTKEAAEPTVASSLPVATASMQPSAALTASAAPSSTAPAAPDLVHVSLVATVPGAEFAFDDEPTMPSPVLVTRPRAKETHRITVTAPGYQTETKSVTLDQDVVWSVELVAKPVASARPTAAIVTSPPPAAVDASAPRAAADASAPPAAVDAIPRPKIKKPLLDPGNPYND